MNEAVCSCMLLKQLKQLTNRQKYTGRLRVRRVFALSIVFFFPPDLLGKFCVLPVRTNPGFRAAGIQTKAADDQKNAIAKSFVCFPTWVFEKSRIEVSQVFSLVAFFLSLFVVSLQKHLFSF